MKTNFYLLLFVSLLYYCNAQTYIVQLHYPLQDTTCSGNYYIQAIIYYNNSCNGYIYDFKWKYTIINDTIINQTGYSDDYCSGSVIWKVPVKVGECERSIEYITYQEVYQKVFIVEGINKTYETLFSLFNTASLIGYSYLTNDHCSGTIKYEVIFKPNNCSWSQFDPEFHCTELGNKFIPSLENDQINLNIYSTNNCQSSIVGNCKRNISECVNTGRGYVKWWVKNLNDFTTTTTTTTTTATTTTSTTTSTTTTTTTTTMTNTNEQTTINTNEQTTINTNEQTTTNVDEQTTSANDMIIVVSLSCGTIGLILIVAIIIVIAFRIKKKRKETN